MNAIEAMLYARSHRVAVEPADGSDGPIMHRYDIWWCSPAGFRYEPREADTYWRRNAAKMFRIVELKDGAR